MPDPALVTSISAGALAAGKILADLFRVDALKEDVAALRARLDTLEARHEALRTSVRRTATGSQPAITLSPLPPPPAPDLGPLWTALRAVEAGVEDGRRGREELARRIAEIKEALDEHLREYREKWAGIRENLAVVTARLTDLLTAGRGGGRRHDGG